MNIDSVIKDIVAFKIEELHKECIKIINDSRYSINSKQCDEKACDKMDSIEYKYIDITKLGLSILGKMKKKELVYLLKTKIKRKNTNDVILDEKLLEQSILVRRHEYDENLQVNSKLIIPLGEKGKDFINVNVKSLIKIVSSLKKSEMKILFYLFSEIDFITETEGEVKFTKAYKQEICNKCNVSLPSIDKAIVSFVKLNILFKIKRGRYCLNFNIAFKGKYVQRILGWRKLLNKIESNNPKIRASIKEGEGYINELDEMFIEYKKLDKSDLGRTVVYRKCEEKRLLTEYSLERIMRDIEINREIDKVKKKNCIAGMPSLLVKDNGQKENCIAGMPSSPRVGSSDIDSKEIPLSKLGKVII